MLSSYSLFDHSKALEYRVAVAAYHWIINASMQATMHGQATRRCVTKMAGTWRHRNIFQFFHAEVVRPVTASYMIDYHAHPVRVRRT
jgi:hypothetical protein